MQHLSKSPPFFLYPYRDSWSFCQHSVRSLTLFRTFLSHSLFFSSLKLLAGRVSAFIVSLQRWGIIEALFYWAHPDKSLQHKISFRESQDGATSCTYKVQHSSYSSAVCIETHKHAYPRGVHGCDRCAETLQWAFQHFWSGQRPAHSFPLSQYLNKHITGKIFLIRQITKQHEHVWSTTDHFFLITVQKGFLSYQKVWTTLNFVTHYINKSKVAFDIALIQIFEKQCISLFFFFNIWLQAFSLFS